MEFGELFFIYEEYISGQHVHVCMIVEYIMKGWKPL